LRLRIHLKWMETLNNLIRIIPAKGNESFQTCQIQRTVSLSLGGGFFLIIYPFLSLSVTDLTAIAGTRFSFRLRENLYLII